MAALELGEGQRVEEVEIVCPQLETLWAASAASSHRPKP